MKNIGKTLLFIILTSCSLLSSAIGEKYSTEGAALSNAIFDNLVAEGFCVNVRDCRTKLDVYGGHGNRVNIAYYRVTDESLIHSIVSFCLKRGLIITKGVDIGLTFFRAPKEPEGKFGFSTKPSVKLEIQK